MAEKRKIIVHLAISADGYIARRDGAVDWLDRPRKPGDYGMAAFVKSIDTILWGRKTYELALAFGEQATAGFGHAKSYVLSSHPPDTAAPGFEFVREPLAEFVARLRATPGKDVWVMGGAGLVGSLLDAGEVDEFVLHVIPTFIGEGIPLLPPSRRLVPLELASVRKFEDGVVRLEYRTERARAPRRSRRAGHGRRRTPSNTKRQKT